jgi:hypothetical protein
MVHFFAASWHDIASYNSSTSRGGSCISWTRLGISSSICTTEDLVNIQFIELEFYVKLINSDTIKSRLKLIGSFFIFEKIYSNK